MIVMVIISPHLLPIAVGMFLTMVCAVELRRVAQTGKIYLLIEYAFFQTLKK
jgi:hypothetical protein